MTISIEGFFIENVEYYQKSLDLRNEIFVNELGFNKHLEFDGKDSNATHYLVQYNGIPVGVARWAESKTTIRIDRFGILKNYRAWGIGLLLIKLIKREIISSGKAIEVISTNETVVFFIQQGFKDNNKIENFENKEVRILTLDL